MNEKTLKWRDLSSMLMYLLIIDQKETTLFSFGTPAFVLHLLNFASFRKPRQYLVLEAMANPVAASSPRHQRVQLDVTNNIRRVGPDPSAPWLVMELFLNPDFSSFELLGCVILRRVSLIQPILIEIPQIQFATV